MTDEESAPADITDPAETTRFTVNLPSVGVGVLLGSIVMAIGGGITALFFGIGIVLGSVVAAQSGHADIHITDEHYTAALEHIAQHVGDDDAVPSEDSSGEPTEPEPTPDADDSDENSSE